MRLILLILATMQWRLGCYELERAQLCGRWVDAAQARAADRFDAAVALMERATERT